MKKFWSMAAAGALLAGSLTVVAPAQATPTVAAPAAHSAVSVAAAKKKVPAPKIALGKKKTSKTKAPNKSVQRVVLPVLKGSTAKNRKLFTKYATDAVKAERTFFDKTRKGYCSAKETAEFSAYPSYRNIYQGRYASVAFDFGEYFCGATSSSTVRSFTMDLKTGKKVGLGSFVSQEDTTTQVAVATKFATTKNTCVGDLGPIETKKGGKGTIPLAIGWNVSSKGIRLHYQKYSIAPGACGAPNVLLPWTQVAKASQMKGKIQNRIYVHGIKYNKQYKSHEGQALYISTQGRKVTIFEGPVSVGDGLCYYGVRTGKKATVNSGPWLGAQEKLSYSTTSANPKVILSSLGKGWKEASKNDLKIIKNGIGYLPTGRGVCGA